MQNVHKVLVVGPLPPQALALFEARPDITVERLDDQSEAAVLARIADASGVTVRSAHITEAVIRKAERLQVVSRFGVGYDRVDVAALTARGIPLTVVGEANSVNVAELTLYLMLELTKRGRQHDHAIRTADWGFRLGENMFELWQKTVLIIGFGRVGRRVAARCQGFEMEVLACDPYIDQQIIRDAGCTPVADFRSALPQTDYLTLHLPLTEESRGMVDADALERMKPTAILTNCARGGIVDEAALYEALSTGGLAAAGLDVFAQEPPAPDNPLLTLDNTIFTPHMGGASREASLRVGIVCAQNVLDAIDGTLNPDLVINREVLEHG